MMEGSQSSTTDDRVRWDRLTDKQRACLDLVLAHKTSKQIARALGISKYTVDQRITAARQILGASDRSDTAIRYARLRQIYDRIAYDPVELPDGATLVPSGFSDDAPSNVFDLSETSKSVDRLSEEGAPSGKIWRHDHRLSARLTIMATVLAAVIIFLLGSLGIAETLTRLVSG